MKTLIVNEKNNGKKLDSFIFASFPSLSKNAFYKALRKKDIRINGKRIHENQTIYFQDEIQIYIEDTYLFGNSFSLFPDRIVYEDNNIVIVDKPCGIEVTRRKFFNHQANPVLSIYFFRRSIPLSSIR